MEVVLTTRDEKSGYVKAVLDSGSFFSIIRKNKVPEGAQVVWWTSPQEFKTAAGGGKLKVIGELPLIITMDEKMVEDSVLISPELSQEMLIGAKTMQAWDISIINRDGETQIVVGRDIRDPDIIEVD